MIYTVSKKHATSSSTVTWTKNFWHAYYSNYRSSKSGFTYL